MKKWLSYLGIFLLALLFLAVPLLSDQVVKVETSGSSRAVHPAMYHYNYRYYRPVRKAGSRQCYWYYTNGTYVYVCR
ncbi:MAG: hypothetical protein S4CHLAM81_03570 [Chlamydiales bacterium]|nr:hypothetical protein [Chlamydiales bacterium]MCH9635147.1 hypothetical protein [Chlamydiales bacterium]MCH9704408.1 hypothetical protein [Chlamydiota bacterium]